MNASRTEFLKSCLTLSLFFAATGPFVSQAAAQSDIAAGRPAEIAVTGGYIYGKPEYGPSNMQGVGFGAMYTRYFHFPVAPSLEGRYNTASTSYIRESTFVGGLRVQGQVLRKLHPYGDFLVGTGKISFKFPAIPTYTSDNSTVYSYGGGLGVDVYRNFQLTVDAQRQNWNLGTAHGGSQAIFHPQLLTVGVKYTIPFRSYVGSSWRRDKNRDK